MLNLVIDIGNSTAKMALFRGGEMLEMLTSSNRRLEGLESLSGGGKFPTPDRAILSTVIDLDGHALSRLNRLPCPLLTLTHRTPLPIVNLYETPETLGTDRLAAVVGAYDRFPGRDLLVIDAGTCITYDFLDAQGRYLGGNISPGIRMRLKALHEFTGRLPLVGAEGPKPEWGRDTDTAIRCGVLQGIEWEVKGYIAAMKHKYPELLVFLTGGDGISFDTSTKNVIFADSFLVLKGLNRILNENR